jgi:ornithine decarboxylase
MLVTEKQAQFFNKASEPETPYLLVDLDVVEAQYGRLMEALPFAALYYAVKCNPAAPLIRTLNRLGARFEAASLPEIQHCLGQGVAPGDIHFGNTIKSSEAIRIAYETGIHSFTVDSPMELEKVARNAPGTKVSYRMETDGKGAAFGLDRKFGAPIDRIADMMVQARGLSLNSYGVSFHVGSQQLDPQAWVRAIENVARLAEKLERHDIALSLVNLGGGFPAVTTPLMVEDQALPPDYIEVFGQVITEAVNRLLPAGLHFVVEPGRYLTADAGILRSSVMLVSQRGEPGDHKRWVYLDAGRFNGLHDAGTVRFPIETSRDDTDAWRTAILAGPTCDSDDILYDEQAGICLPDPLAEGDKVMFGGTGAYSTCFSTVGFNGFPALKEYYI